MPKEGGTLIAVVAAETQGKEQLDADSFVVFTERAKGGDSEPAPLVAGVKTAFPRFSA